MAAIWQGEDPYGLKVGGGDDMIKPWSDDYESEPHKTWGQVMDEQIAALLRVAMAAQGVLSGTVNNIPVAEYECVCHTIEGNKYWCPLHNLEEALKELPDGLLE